MLICQSQLVFTDLTICGLTIRTGRFKVSHIKTRSFRKFFYYKWITRTDVLMCKQLLLLLVRLELILSALSTAG